MNYQHFHHNLSQCQHVSTQAPTTVQKFQVSSAWCDRFKMVREWCKNSARMVQECSWSQYVTVYHGDHVPFHVLSAGAQSKRGSHQVASVKLWFSWQQETTGESGDLWWPRRITRLQSCHFCFPVLGERHSSQMENWGLLKSSAFSD